MKVELTEMEAKFLHELARSNVKALSKLLLVPMMKSKHDELNAMLKLNHGLIGKIESAQKNFELESQNKNSKLEG